VTFSLDGGIDEIPLHVGTEKVAGRLWLCGKHVVAPDPEALLARLPADGVVCLVEDPELSTHWPHYLEWMAENAGGRSVRYPIGDFEAPPLDEFRPFLDKLVARLQRGDGLVVHCAAGIGRSGTTAVALLMLLGLPADEALCHVRQHRRMAGPEVGAQRQLIDDLAAALGR
jgi:protein-tyrosine phosphatase